MKYKVEKLDDENCINEYPGMNSWEFHHEVIGILHRDENRDRRDSIRNKADEDSEMLHLNRSGSKEINQSESTWTKLLELNDVPEESFQTWFWIDRFSFFLKAFTHGSDDVACSVSN